MAVIEINWRPSDRELRLFAAVQLVVAFMAAWLIYRKYGTDALAIVMCVVSSAILVTSLISPRLVRPLFLAWMITAFPIGWVMSHVLLAIVYYAVVTPIAFALRMAGRDTLQRKPRPDAATYWTPRPTPPESNRYFRQF